MPDPLKSPSREMREVASGADANVPQDSGRDYSGRGLSSADPTAQDAAHLRQDEANMRRALNMLGGSTRPQPTPGSADRRPPSFGGSGGHSASHSGSHSGSHAGGQTAPRRHRFVQDGEVPVTVVRRGEHAPDPLRHVTASPVNRLDALQESLLAEQAARAAAERALEEALATIRALQTRLSHMEMTRDEMIAGAVAEAVEEALARAADQAQAQAQAEAQAVAVAEEATAAPAIAPVAEDAAEKPAAAPRAARGRRIKPVEPAIEPEPIKWWITSRSTKPVTRRRLQNSTN